MKSLKNNIRKILKARLDVSYRIKIKGPDRETMNKKIFVEVIDQLKKIEDRFTAKKKGNYKLADQIRDELFKKGIIIEDQKGKTTWKFK